MTLKELPPQEGTREAPLDPTAEPERDPYVGLTVTGDIELTAVLGAGAMGRVYRGHQRSVGRDVAVKVLHPELSSNLHLVQRFQREAKLASRIRHAHVVEVYLAGQLHDGALYIVMEYLDGLSLSAALEAAGGAIPVERALGIAMQICDAVGEAHAHVVVHRDLKPENVMLVRRGDTADWVKVLDFGIAKGAHGAQSMETAAGQIFGTARYISPEGAQGGAVGPASDVYSLATIVYQMLAGRTPFNADQAVGLLVKHIYEAPPDLALVAASRGVPDEIARVVMENLAKDPAQRAPNAHAFGRALATAAKAARVVVPDESAFARLSLVDAPPASTTLLDARAVPSARPDLGAPPSVDMPAAGPRSVAKQATLPLAAAQGDEGERAPRITTLGGTIGSEPLPPAPRGRHRLAIAFALTFVLGIATALGAQAVRQRGDARHAAFVARAQKALADRHYTGPKGENLRELVETGLVQWPDDPTLVKLRADGAQELLTRAIALHSGGDVEGARDSARRALELAPTSYPAKLLAEQYDGELRALDTPAGIATGTPRVLFKVPRQAHPGERFELVGRVLPRASGPRAAIEGAKMSLHETLNGPGTALAMTDAGSGSFTAYASLPEPGRWFVVFEASIDGRLLRAERPVEIAR